MRSIVLAFVLVLALPVSSALAAGTLTVGITGAGAVSGSGIDCSRDVGKDTSGTCSAVIKDVVVCETDPKPHCTTETGVAVVGARSAAGFAFDSWGGSCDNPSSATCSITMGGNERLTARFKDVQTPTVSIGRPAPGNLAGTVPVDATASDNVAIDRVEFSVRGVVMFTDTTAPFGGNFNTTGVIDGAASITATAFDTAGLSKSASVSTVIDNTKPQLVVTGPDKQAFLLGSTQSWAINAADPTTGIAQLRCSLVAFGAPASFGTCSGGLTAHSVTGKPEGTYSFSVRATDGAGNVTEATRNFKIDATAPDTTISSGVADGDVTSETSLTWTLESGENATFECRVYPAALTPGAFAPCSGGESHTASGFAPGVYAFEVRATDGVGNVDASPAKRTFTIEPAPVVPVVGTAPGPEPKSGASSVPGGGSAAGPDAAPQIVVTLGFSFSSFPKATKVANLIVKNLPSGATVTVKCPKGCAKKTFKKAKVSGQLSLRAVVKKPLKLGTKLTVIVSKPGFSSAVKVLTIRARKAPLVTTLCQPEGAPKPAAC